MEPVRFPTSPRIDLNVDVRPAPLRPRSVTTSPLFTAKSTPWSTCDSPYQAWRLETRRTSFNWNPALRGYAWAVPMYASTTCGFVETSAYGPSASTAPRWRTVMVSEIPDTTLML